MYYILLSEEPHFVALLSFSCAGAFIYLSGFLIAFSVWELCILILLKSEKLKLRLEYFFHTHNKIRTVILGSRFHTVISLLMTVAFTGFGLYAAFSPPRVRFQTIYLKSLPGALDGFNITLLTDVHIGPTVGRRRVQEAVDLVNSLKPGTTIVSSVRCSPNIQCVHMIAIAGDLVDGSVEKLYLAADPLKYLQAKHGVYFSTGNHEYYYGDVDDWLRHLEAIGIHPLHNSHVKIVHPEVPAAYFCFAGVDDSYAESSGVPGHRTDVGGALSGCDRRKLVIMMVHQPNRAKKILNGPEGYAVDLILSGHTHGGQLYVLAPVAYLSQAYYLGLYRHQSGSQIYVSAGLNFFGPPLKMYGFREITQITLRRI